MGATRTDIRRGIGDVLGEMFLYTATAVSADETTFTDATRLMDRENNAPSLLNRIIYFSGGTSGNLGHEARVTSFSRTPAPTLTFTPAAPLPPQEGDEIELWVNWTRFGSISALHRLINEGLRAVEDIAGEEAYDDEDGTTFATSDPYIDIPAEWAEFGGAEYQCGGATSLRWRELPEESLRVRPSLRTVEIKRPQSYLANTHPVRLYGYERVDLFTDDTTETPVRADWLINAVAGVMKLGPSWQTAAAARSMDMQSANYWGARGDVLQRAVGGSRRGMGIDLPS